MVKRIFSPRGRRRWFGADMLASGINTPRRRLFGRRRHYVSRIVWGGLALLGTLWVAGLFAFIAAVPREPNATVESADAIVVLTGGGNRVTQAMQLLAQNKGSRLLISGVHEDTSREELLERYSDDVAAVACCVDLDRAALDTKGNAVETRHWVESRGYKTLIVVTANYHMPRSLLEFRRAMPGVKLIPHPVFPEGFSPTAEWDWGVAGRLVVAEYLKFTASYMMP